ncbi:hypothetical protein [Hymenobacter sp. YC55]|uniref:hypothetical protein n=1 Tax=Hymenobacter sp. YC55 TaxID=3034019 RepID=UPI0023F6916F|nr:hypothetical protein [Hymenobacter sp. YC55]MDF7811995.1 hypothetical protein [Hymenobacter sp. YC55]
MEPTQSTDQNQNTQPTASTSAETSGSAASKTSNGTGQRSTDSTSWTEYANPQKVVDQLPQGVRDFFTNSWAQVGKSWDQAGQQIGKMSTTQKVAGAAALVGIGYLAMRSGKSSKKESGRYKSSPSTNRSYQRPEQNYYSGTGYSSSGQYYSAGSRPDTSRRMDMGPSADASSFDRENVSRSGGTYSPDSSASNYGAGSSNQSSSTYRGAGSQGSSGSYSSNADSDYDTGI